MRYERLKVKGYRSWLDEDIDFPEKQLEGDLDILVLGGKTGSGKTTILNAAKHGWHRWHQRAIGQALTDAAPPRPVMLLPADRRLTENRKGRAIDYGLTWNVPFSQVEALDVLDRLLGEYTCFRRSGQPYTLDTEYLPFPIYCRRHDASDDLNDVDFARIGGGAVSFITTLMTIWQATKDEPHLVLVDEPELHLNAELQRAFCHELRRIAPHNQYVLTTNSEEVFASVLPHQRLLLEDWSVKSLSEPAATPPPAPEPG